jgi:uncharacterized coiled-coil DUF342 family protein
MIEEKINNSLKELENGLKDLESARKQVEKTIGSYENLSKTTGEYVNELGNITTKIHEIVDSIGKDYYLKIKEFEKDRDTIVNASDAATEKISNAAEGFKNSLSILKTRLIFSIIINVISVIAIITVIILQLK